MKNTLDFIADIKAIHGVESDYAVAKLLNVGKNTISNYRNHKSGLSDEMALRVAHLLDLDDAYVMACIHAERSRRDDEKQVWQKIAEHFGWMAAALALACFVPLIMSGTGSAQAHDFPAYSAFNLNIHYAKYAALLIFIVVVHFTPAPAWADTKKSFKGE